MGYQERIERLAKTSQPRQEWWSRVFATPVANMILAMVADCPRITPNRLTFLSFFLTIATSVLVFSGDSLSIIIAGMVLQVAYIVDCMDGQLARYRKTASKTGSFYDQWSDFVKFPFVLVALALAAFHRSNSVLPVVLGLVCVFLTVYLPYLKLLADREFGIRLWGGLSGGGFLQRNLRFFLFEEAQWYLLVSVSLLVNHPLSGLILIASTQGLVAIARTWRVFRLVSIMPDGPGMSEIAQTES